VIDLRFEWDEVKNRSNQRKHGISFEIAARVFADPFALTEQDRVEDGEPRWRTFGLVGDFALLVVAHTRRDEDSNGRPFEVIRIISARPATRRERRRYEEDEDR
jgi:uncharacterized DUF497 family protein